MEYKINCNICNESSKFFVKCSTCKNSICDSCTYNMLLYGFSHQEIKILRNGKILNKNKIIMGYKCPYCRKLVGIDLKYCKFILGIYNKCDTIKIKTICRCNYCPLLKIKHYPCNKGCYACENSTLEMYFEYK